MVYNDLSNTGTPDSRLAEAKRIIGIIQDISDGLTPKELKFVSDMEDSDYCSTKQLFYLRDIKDMVADPKTWVKRV